MGAVHASAQCRGHRSTSEQCPLYPRKRTFAHAVRMSALGQKQTSAASFDYLVSGGKQRRRDAQAERLGGLEIEDKLDFGRLHDRSTSLSRRVSRTECPNSSFATSLKLHIHRSNFVAANQLFETCRTRQKADFPVLWHHARLTRLTPDASG
jgi:hypothetical protein